MTVDQLPADIEAFVRYFNGLLARLDPDGGWYAVFRQRDPEGMQACLEGREIPPWDVAESLLQDLRAGDAAESTRAAQLHAAAAAAHDRLPGGRAILEERAELMRHERLRAQARAEELLRLLAASPDDARLTHDLAWTRDDHSRAVRRQTELESRAAALAAARPAPPPNGSALAREPRGATTQCYGPLPGGVPDDGRYAAFAPAHGQPQGAVPAEAPDAARAEAHDGHEPMVAAEAEAPQGSRTRRGGGTAPGPGDDGAAPARKGKKPRRPRGGARFAGIEGAGDDAVAVPVLPVAGDTPRGARYGGGADADPVPEAGPAPDEGAERAAGRTVAALCRLRAEGRGGEAHALLCEAAARPAAWLPVLADELHRSGLAADWTTLLWEAASQPVSRLAAAADALVAAGRGDDGRQLLRQGVFRSADEIADAVRTLVDTGAPDRARSLLAAFVQVRAPEDSAAMAAGDPVRLVPLLLDAARAASPARERDVVHALRVAGHIHS